jgi:DNA-binding winged helix-turn-helix (wHTH) protein/tetratricopeptide (TPR) repeat protein
MRQPVGTPDGFKFGEDFELDVGAYELRSAGVPLKLKPIPMELLLLLLERRGELVTREQIVERIWGGGVAFDTDNSINGAISRIRQVLRDDPERPKYVQTVPSRGYRFIAPVEASVVREIGIAHSGVEGVVPETVASPTGPMVEIREIKSPAGGAVEKSGESGRHWWKIAALAAAFAGAGWIASVLHSRSGQANLLTDKDTIVVADFANNTVDPIFDETMKQALSVQLTQSPFLNVASDLKVSEMLRRMGRSPDETLTGEVARDLCLRLGGKAMLTGSISSLGSHYLVSVNAVGCANGDLLAAGQMEAANKESVLKALDSAASQVRAKLGESIASLEKYDFPVDTTTNSLEALQSFSRGVKALRERGEGEAIPFFRQAIRLDPDFALAYATLGRAYEDVGEDNEAATDFAKAFQFPERLSEREKYYVTTMYYETATGEMEQAKETGALWVRTYPRDGIAREKLGTIYGELGENEKAAEEFDEALRLDPDSTINVFNSVAVEASLNRMEDARRTLETAQARGVDGAPIHQAAYEMAFLRNDSPEMQKQVAWATGKAVTEEGMFSQHSDTVAYSGQLGKARELSKRAVEASTRDKAIEIAALCQMAAVLRDVETGSTSGALQAVQAALRLAPSRNVKVMAALVLARSGNARQAKALIHDLESRYPSNTLIQSYWLPTTKAALEVRSGNADSAISLLQKASPYDLAQTSNLSNITSMYPVYVRGQAYLLAKNRKAAATEFKKILDSPGIVQNGILGVLARVELARAEAAMGDRESARKDYSDFLALWKDADPNIPILKEARMEYTRLN